MERCGFFNAKYNNDTGNYDREYEVADFARYFASFVGNGVFPNPSDGLQVMETDEKDMNIVVCPGQAWVDGYWYENTKKLQLPISPADGVLNRIDIVVIRWDSTERNMYARIIEGTPAVNPIEPQYQRTADYSDLVLAKVKVNAGITKITQTHITDTRMDKVKCGQVAALVNQLDTTSWGNQLTRFIEEFINDSNSWASSYESDFENRMNQFFEGKKNEFLIWFESVKDILDENVAGNLQNQIEDLKVAMLGLQTKTTTFLEDGTMKEELQNGDYILSVVKSNFDIHREMYNSSGTLLCTYDLVNGSDGSITETFNKE